MARGRHHVIFCCIHTSAEMLIYPSLFKGFGLPPVEAMICGIPVIASKVGAIPEVVAGAALLIDPLNTNDIREAIEKLCVNEELRCTRSTAGQSFSWDKAARETSEHLEWVTHA
jgi:glycosyltransferase involved in cell wall biosynthesis